MKVSSRQRRARIVTITRWGVFLFGVWNSGRAVALVSQSAALSQLGVDPALSAVRAAAAALWAYIFFFEWVAIGRKRPFTRLAVPLTIALYGLYELTLLLLLSTAPITSLFLLSLLGYALASAFAAWSLR